MRLRNAVKHGDTAKINFIKSVVMSLPCRRAAPLCRGFISADFYSIPEAA